MRLFVVALLISGWLLVPGAYAGRAEKGAMSTQGFSFEQSAKNIAELKPYFDEALGQGGALHRTSLSPYYFEHGGYGLSYCFEYQEAGSVFYQEFQRLVQTYTGKLPWISSVEFNNKGACLAFTPPDQLRVGRPLAFIHSKELIADAKHLCKYLAHFIAHLPKTPTSQFTKVPNLPDPDEAGIYEIYVLAHPQTGIHGVLHETDRQLHFGPTKDEWADLNFTIKETPGHSVHAESAGKFPLLSRLNNPYEKASYGAAEVEALRQECDLASHLAQTEAGRGSIDKILSAINWANHLKSGLLFIPAD